MNRKRMTKTALAMSACLFVLWWLLGAGATLAWFTDTSDTVRNEFIIGDLHLNVLFKNDMITEYTPLEDSTEVFNDQALYEPGYTQVIFLKIENLGDVAFDYKMSVTVHDMTTATSVLGNEIYLPNYLQYGVIFAESEEELRAKLDRQSAQELADEYIYRLNTWSEISPYTFEVGEDPHYAALIVTMPEEVGNAANYRGNQAPTVQLGITVFAQQADAVLE